MDMVRSLLSVPGNQPRMLEKAPGYDADALILDLEDSVPADRKAEARAMTAEFISSGAGGAMTYVRVNSPESGLLEDDLAAVVTRGLAGIQCPKTDSPEAIVAIDAKLSHLERERGLEPGSVEIIAGIESVAGVYHCYDILSAAARVGSCVVGVAENGDLQRDVGYAHSESGVESLYIRSKVILEARHAGITNALDGTFSAINDMERFEAEAAQARGLGYRGKKLIHPKQIESTNRIFMPSAQEIDFHERVLAALAAAEAEGKAATTVDGLMVDIAMAVNARRVLSWASRISNP
ncbi:MAG: CoA ester lyase [Acidimicrobiia bacterium]|nr:CoA ester lyase [Acidimicrobiia bacterium]